MKKIFLSLLPIMLAPIISACQDTANSIIAIKTIDDSFTFVELDYEKTINLIDSKQEFILETYSPTCSHCAELEPLLVKFSQSRDSVIYRLNMYDIFKNNQEQYQNLLASYPEIFPDEGVPTIKFIKDKTPTYVVSSNKFSSYTALSKIMDKHLISSNITMIASKDALMKYEESNKTYVAFVYDLNSNASLTAATKSIINKDVASSKKPIVLLNKASFAANFDEIKTFYSSEFDSFACYVNNGNKEKAINYLSDDGSSLNELISNLH